MNKTQQGIAILTVFVVAVLATAFSIGGNPRTAKDQKEDSKLSSNIISVANSVRNWHNSKQSLPANLNLVNLSSNIDKSKIAYTVIDKDSFQICAAFKTDNRNSKSTQFSPADNGMEPQPYMHIEGQNCFTYTVTAKNPAVKDLMPPVKSKESTAPVAL